VTTQKRLVLDANILVRGVFGQRVPRLIEDYEFRVSFHSPDVCFEETRRSIPDIASNRKFDMASASLRLEQLSRIVLPIDSIEYEQHEAEARRRIFRDVSDWPIVATAMLLRCPIWTEDRDFFGSGVATWTTENVELYLRDG
jgi:predicted nucleic acid-binding protein